MKIKIKVTKEVLKESMFCPLSKHTHCNDDAAFDFLKTNCAVSVAIRDLFPDAKVYQSAVFLDGTLETRVGFEPLVMMYIKTFDEVDKHEERLCLPEIFFDIEVPDAVIERIGIGQVYKILSESKTLEYVG